MPNKLLDVENLRMYFPIQAGLFKKTVGYVKAVDNVSFALDKGEILGIVGESGCGKSTLGRSIMRIYNPTAGTIKFDGIDITRLAGSKLRKIRRNFQMIFQDPYASLNPKMRILNMVSEPMQVDGMNNKSDADMQAETLLKKVGIRREDINKYPHQLSGGQRQRVCIARALSLMPKMIVADEPVSALDVSIQSQILNLLLELKNEFVLSYLFISHNLAVVSHVCDRVIVMYLGNIVEYASKEELFANPCHPYTKALISASPDIRRDPSRKKIILKGEVPNAAQPPSGCLFHTRCPKKLSTCSLKKPDLSDLGDGHFIACHLFD